MSTLLAERWAQKCHEDWNTFEDEPDKTLAVVQVALEIEKDEVLYLDDPTYHLDLRMTLADFAVKYFNLNSIFDLTKEQFRNIESKLYGLVEGYIKLIEKHLGRTIKVVFKCQISPHKRDVISQLVGNASCFSVRDTSCIKSMHWSPA